MVLLLLLFSFSLFLLVEPLKQLPAGLCSRIFLQLLPFDLCCLVIGCFLYLPTCLLSFFSVFLSVSHSRPYQNMNEYVPTTKHLVQIVVLLFFLFLFVSLLCICFIKGSQQLRDLACSTSLFDLVHSQDSPHLLSFRRVLGHLDVMLQQQLRQRGTRAQEDEL